MEYPFKFNEMLLTERALDKLGFSEYWSGCGDYGHRSIIFNDAPPYRRYEIMVIDEKDEAHDGYVNKGQEEYVPQHYYNSNTNTRLYFLHEMFEDLKATHSEEDVNDFLSRCDKANMTVFIKSYLNQ